MPITPNEVRRLALTLPETSAGAHHEREDVRVRSRIFLTLRPDEGWVVLKLAPEQQALLVAAEPALFNPVAGGWGRRGATVLQLAKVDEATVRSALLMAWRRAAPKRLAAAHGASFPPAWTER